MSDIRRMLHCKVTSPLTLPVAQFCLFRYVHLSETRGGGGLTENSSTRGTNCLGKLQNPLHGRFGDATPHSTLKCKKKNQPSLDGDWHAEFSATTNI